METCPCGSGKAFSDCCSVYISGEKAAPTPEALMRSRYTAYVVGEVDYVGKTQTGKAAAGFDPNYAKEWSKQATWFGLKVIDVKAGASKSQVEFLALYELGGNKSYMHEISDFEKLEDKWIYTDGKFVKTGRNDPCPCKSGQKFKKCCGTN